MSWIDIQKNIKELLFEFVATFSSDKSYFSSKRIERCIVFLVMLFLTIFFVVKKHETLSAPEFVLIIGTWLGYAGFNTVQIKNDKTTDDAK